MKELNLMTEIDFVSWKSWGNKSISVSTWWKCWRRRVPPFRDLLSLTLGGRKIKELNLMTEDW